MQAQNRLYFDMASTKDYLQYILDELSFLDGISSKPMMGEYLLYLDGKLFGGIYDNRLLLKATPSALALLPSATLQTPYDGAKPMFFIDNLDDKPLLQSLILAVINDLTK